MRHGGLALALLAFTAACADEKPEPRIPQPVPLPPGELPLLRCVEPLPMAGECARDADCGSARCVLDERAQAADREPIALHCGAPQGTRPAREPCEEAGECESGLCSLAGVCLAPCASHADCIEGQFCQPLEARVGSEALAPVMACASNMGLPADVAFVSASPEGTLAPNRLNMLDVPGFAGHGLLYLRVGCERFAQVQRLSEVGGRTLFHIDALVEGRQSDNPITNQGALIPILLPNNPSLSASERGYRLGVAVDGETRGELVVASRTHEGRVLDLNVFYVGGGEDIVEGGLHPGDPHAAALFADLAQRYADIGITLGTVREFDVVGALREQFAVLETELTFDDEGNLVDLFVDGIDELLSLSAGVEGGGMNLFLVREIGDVLGISGGIPGTLGVSGTPGSGVALALDVTGVAGALNVLLHEMSHQMGLFHTTEFDGSSIEPLSDTPVCPLTRDLDGDGLVSPRECRGLGADNLMFWAGSGVTLSSEQVRVLRRSLVLR